MPLSRAGNIISQKLTQLNPPLAEPDVWDAVVQGAGQVTGMLVGGAGLKMAGATLPVVTAGASTMGGIQEFDDAYQRAGNRGDDPDTRLAKSLGYAAVATMIENRLGAGRLLRQWFPNPDLLAKKLTALGVSKAVVGNFLAGGAEEGSQRWAQNLMIEGKPSMEGVMDEAIPGAIVQGFVGAPGSVSQRLESDARYRREQAFDNAIVDNARKVSLDASMPRVGTGEQLAANRGKDQSFEVAGAFDDLIPKSPQSQSTVSPTVIDTTGLNKTPVAVQATSPASGASKRPTRHRVFEGGAPMLIRDGDGVLSARNTENAYRITDQPQIDDMLNSGEVRAREGKMRGGRTGEVQWSRGHESLGYRAQGNEGRYVIEANAQGLNNRDGGMPLSEVKRLLRSDGTKWVDVTNTIHSSASKQSKVRAELEALPGAAQDLKPALTPEQAAAPATKGDLASMVADLQKTLQQSAIPSKPTGQPDVQEKPAQTITGSNVQTGTVMPVQPQPVSVSGRAAGAAMTPEEQSEHAILKARDLKDDLSEAEVQRMFALNRKETNAKRHTKTEKQSKELKVRGVVIPDEFYSPSEGKENHITGYTVDNNGFIQVRIETHDKVGMGIRFVTVKPGDTLTHGMDDSIAGTTRYSESNPQSSSPQGTDTKPPQPLTERKPGEVTAQELLSMSDADVKQFFEINQKRGNPAQFDAVLAGMKLDTSAAIELTQMRDAAQKAAMDAVARGDNNAFFANQGRVVWLNGAIEGAKREGPNYDSVKKKQSSTVQGTGTAAGQVEQTTPPSPVTPEQITEGDWIEYVDSFGKTQQGKVDAIYSTAAIVPSRAGVQVRGKRTEYSVVDANGKPMVAPAQGTSPKKIAKPLPVTQEKTKQAVAKAELGETYEDVANRIGIAMAVGIAPNEEPGDAKGRAGATLKNGQKVVFDIATRKIIKIETSAPIVAQDAPKVEQPAQIPAASTATDAKMAAILAKREELKARLRKKLAQTNISVDPEVATIAAELAVNYAQEGVVKFGDFARRVKADLPDIWDSLKQYLRGAWATATDISDNLEDVSRDEAKNVLAEIDGEKKPADKAGDNSSIRMLILSQDSRMQKSHQMRKMADDLGITLKEMQERIEAELVVISHEIASDPELSEEDKFRQFVLIYDRQPLFSARTSTSVDNQAYSTPVPMAYSLSVMTGISTDTGMYEPTAGNAMLMIGSNLSKSAANEINDLRAKALRNIGVGTVTQNDATKFVPSRKFEAVHANPPFGGISNVNYNGYGIRKLEHLISLKALEAMQDNGTAALILGANMENEDTRKGAQWVFENYLYGNYNVVDNFEVSGELYAGQGAKWPVRIIVISGRKAQVETGDLAPKRVDRLSTWDEVWSRTKETRDEAKRIHENMVSGGSTGISPDIKTGTTPTTNAGVLPVGSDITAGTVGGRSKQGGKRGSQPTNEVDIAGGSSSVGTAGGISQPQDIANPSNEPSTRGGQTPQLESGDRPSVNQPANVEGTGGDRGEGANTRVLSKPIVINERQITYVPRSGGEPFGTLSPTTIGNGTHAALDEMISRVGSIDSFVSDRLNMPVDELRKVMSADQIDGVALAIDQIETGGALIIGDETGIGKGRQAAALIRYAMLQGKIPIFFTLDPKLFSDMHGDLKDINTTVKPLIFGDVAKATIVGPDGTVLVKAPGSAAQRTIIDKINDDGFADSGYNAIFSTYSQVNQTNARQAFFERLAENENVILILDEAHSAAGDGQSSMQAAFMQGGTVTRGSGASRTETTVPGLLRLPGLSRGRGGVAYLSATFAKRPDNMPLYFRTALSRASRNFTAIVEALKAGGVALQQAISEALAKEGQYIRRERDFTGVSYTMKRVDVADPVKLVQQVDDVTSVLSSIVKFSERVVGRVAMTASGASGTAMTQNQIDVAPFASVVHNQVSQLLLSAKADEVVNEALAAHKRGEKPVIALMNTMESFLSGYVADNNIKEGQSFSLTWQELLKYALSRTLRQSEKLGNGDTVISIIDPSTIGLQDRFDEIIDSIKEIDVQFPVSPIDYIIQKLNKAGVKMGELTGRESGIEYTDFNSGRGTYKRFKKANKNALVNGFNGGDLNGLLLNASGATGLSIHAAPKFKDTSKRHMIIAQPALDINVFVQTLGRIKRTGMLFGSAIYTHLVLPLQAELRPAAVTSRKMKSLNANTTAEADSSVKIDSDDFLNKYGDEVVAEYLHGIPELQTALDLDIDVDADGVPVATEDLAKKFMGRMALLPNAQQAEAYAAITPAYRALVEQLKSTGEYDLDIIVHDDWDGTMLSDLELAAGTDESSLFTASVRAQQWEITDNRHVPTGAEMEQEFIKNTGGKEKLNADWKQFQESVNAGMTRRIAEAQGAVDKANAMPETDPNKALQLSAVTAQLSTANTLSARWDDLSDRIGRILMRAGDAVELTHTETGETWDGMLIDFKFPDISKGLRVNASRFQFRYLVNAPGGRMYVAGSKMGNAYTQSPSTQELSDFTGARKGQRYPRWFVTGNPIAAYTATGGSGKVVRFTARDGQTVTGLQMPTSWNVSKLAEDPRFSLVNGRAVAQFLRNQTGFNKIGVDGGLVRITPQRYSNNYTLSVPSARRTGGDFYLDPELVRMLGDFTKTGARFIVDVKPEQLENVSNRVATILGKSMKSAGTGQAIIDQVATANQSAQKKSDKIEDALNKAIKKTDDNGGRTLEGVTGAPFWMTKSALNGVLRIIRAAYKAGKSLAEAIKEGVDWLRSSGLAGFNETEASDWLNKNIIENEQADTIGLKRTRSGRGSRLPKNDQTQLEKTKPFQKNLIQRSLSQVVRGASAPKAFVEARERGLADQKYIEENIRLALEDLRSAINAEFKTKAEQDQANERLLSFLNGEADASTIGGPIIQLRATEIRKAIDDLSAMAVSEGLVSGQMAETWLNNSGEWLKRTYLAFDSTSDWNYDTLKRRKDNGDVEVSRIWDNIENYLQRQNPNMDDGQIEAEMRSLINRQEVEDALGMSSRQMGGTGKRIAVDTTSLLRRKNLSPEVREWMGEIKDPYAKVLQSGKWMAQFITRNLTQRRFARIGLDMGVLSETKTGVFTEQLYESERVFTPERDEEGSPRTTEEGEQIGSYRTRVDRQHEPLSGYYTTPEFKAALDEFDAKMNNILGVLDFQSVVGRTFMGITNYQKGALVAWNPASWGVNTLGGLVNRMAASMYSPVVFTQNLARAYSAVRRGNKPEGFKTIPERFASLGGLIDVNATHRNLVARADYLLATREGLVGKGIMLGDVQANLRQEVGKQSTRRAIKAIKDILSDPKAGGAYVRLRQAISDFWRTPGEIGIRFYDDVFRVSAFFDELHLAKKAHPEMSFNAQVEWAADRASNIYQNYDRLPKIIRDASRVGALNTFVSFKAEVFRNAWWIGKYAKDGMGSNNAELKADGYRKAAALTTMMLAPFALAALMRGLKDVDDEKDKALKRWIVAPWDRSDDLAYVSVDGTKYGYVPMGYIFPTFELSRPGYSIWNALNDPNPDEAIVNAASGWAADYVGPGAVIGPLAEGAFNMRIGQRRPLTMAEGSRGMADRLGYVAENFTPRAFRMGQEAYRAATGQSGDFGREYSLNEIGAKLSGLRQRTVDVEKAAPYVLRGLAARFTSATTYQNQNERKSVTKGIEASAYEKETKDDLKALYKQALKDLQMLGVPEQKLRSMEKAAAIPVELRGWSAESPARR
jgi:hypothetical protein